MTLTSTKTEEIISIDNIPNTISTPQIKPQAAKPIIKQIISKAFFGKNNCLKVTFNNQRDCYFEFGTALKEKWSWKKVKLNDGELGDILRVLEGKSQSVSFFHDFKGDKTQIWINKKDDLFFIKVRELSKSLSTGEQRVLEELLKFMIMRSSLLY